MKLKTLLLALAISGSPLLVALEPLSAGEETLLGRIESRYRSAPQTEVEFLHIVISEFFETADTVQGSILFDTSGRYRTRLGGDEYIFDGHCLWEYSGLYRQATRNCLKTGQRIDDSFLFFTRFSDYYTIEETVADSLYDLRIFPKRKGAAPDSLIVEVSRAESRIVELRYYDINEELNIARLVTESSTATADTTAFGAEFPDSTEIIEIHD